MKTDIQVHFYIFFFDDHDFFDKKFQLRLSEILCQTKYHFDQLASQCAEGRIMNRRIARKSFFEGLLKLGVRLL